MSENSKAHPSIVSAFVRRATPVKSHEEVLGYYSGPVRVSRIDGRGAHLEDYIEPGQVVLYDLVRHREVVRTEKYITGKEVGVEMNEDGDTRPIIESSIEEREVIDQEQYVETFAVSYAVE